MKLRNYTSSFLNPSNVAAQENMSYSGPLQEPSLGPQILSKPVCAKFEPVPNETRPKPGGTPANQNVDEIKVKPEAMEKLEAALGKAPPNCVVIANPQGVILKSFRLNDSTLEKYSSFEKYVGVLAKMPEKKPCKRISNACVLCQDGKIYCTNAVKYRQKKSDN
jgi:hypothetical protein